MIKKFSGEATCELHGRFEWYGTFYDGMVICDWDDMYKHCGKIMKTGNEYRIPVVCPKCHRTYIIMEKDNGR